MNGWTWREMEHNTPPARTIIMEKADRGGVYIFRTTDGLVWQADITRAAGHDPITEPVAYEHMMELKAIAEKPD